MTDLFKIQIANKICQIFELKNISQNEFSKLLGIRQAKFSRIINRHLNEFSLESLIKYLELLNIKMEFKIND